METVEVQVKRDHLERLAKGASPIVAICELIWNSLDADATQVEVVLERNVLSGLESIRIVDNGHGISLEDAKPAFENLGGSWKRTMSRTQGGRILHGKQGKGRFYAFGLGEQVSWSTRYLSNKHIQEYVIRSQRDELQKFIIGDESHSDEERPGTIVEITAIGRPLPGLESPRATQVLTEEFALYLRQYTDIVITYDGQQIDPAAIEEHVADYDLAPVQVEGGRSVESSLTIIEWAVRTERALFLCDADGFALERTQVGIHAPGFTFTAYLKTNLVRELDESGSLQLDELNPDLAQVLSVARETMRDHFRRRASERAVDLVEEWKKEDVYPYAGEPINVVETAERQVFDVLALNVNEFLPDFNESSAENKRLSFRLLRTAIESSPEAVQSIIHDVLQLPADKQEEFAQLLEKTSLEAMINASKLVADRLDFLQGLEVLVFDPDVKGKVLERRHLHRIVAEHTWIFGEEFNLTVSDRSLTNVLKRHLELTNRELLEDAPVLREDGTQGIVDLMLSRVVPQPRADQNEHLVVELKRPTVIIDNTEVSQVKDYATAIMQDERFHGTNTRWEFWVVSNSTSQSVELDATQDGRPHGLLLDQEELGLRIWVRTWGQLIDGCRSRLQLFQEKLNYAADEGSGLEYLRQIHAKYLPKFLTAENETEEDSLDDP